MKAETLKKSILQYAMQGKLVAQNPNDEPASELLKRIKSEKEQLIKDGKILKKKPLEPFSADDIPFEIPKTWEWVYLSDVSIIQEGAGIRSYQYRDSGTQLLTVTNILEGGIDLQKSTKFVDTNEYLEKYKHLTPQIGDIVTACSGGSWGKSAIYDKEDITMLNTSTLRLRFFSDLADNKYLYFITKSGIFMNQLECQLSGMQPNFGYQHYSKILIPIPPLEEQQRIVEKLEEILPLVEEYGKNEEILSEMNKKLPKQIRQSILQYAVQGKLVEQNPNDEPASELLKRIKAEKEQLIKDGKIKKEKTLPPITTDEIPYELPQGWEWVKLGEICSKIVDGDHNPPSGHPVKTNYLMLSASNINYDKIVDLDKVRYLTKEAFDEENKRTNLHVDDILFTIVGTLGRSCIYDGNLNICFQRSVSVLTTLIYNKYLKIVLDSPYIQSFMQKNATGTAQKGFYLNQVSNLIIPLPPFAEQQRIVTKVEELMQIVDKLEVK